jgi:hypothetical protein
MSNPLFFYTVAWRSSRRCSRCRGNSQSKYSTSFKARQIVVFPARRTPGNQITDRLFHRRSNRSGQKGRNHMHVYLHIVWPNAKTLAFANTPMQTRRILIARGRAFRVCIYTARVVARLARQPRPYGDEPDRCGCGEIGLRQ